MHTNLYPEIIDNCTTLAGFQTYPHIDNHETGMRAGKALFADWEPRALDLYVREGLAERADGSVELKCPGEVEAAIFERGVASDLWEAAPRVAIPTLLLWASRGDFPRPMFEALAARMPGAELRSLEAGHLAVMERPDLVLEQVIDFAGTPAD